VASPDSNHAIIDATDVVNIGIAGDVAVMLKNRVAKLFLHGYDSCIGFASDP
jgi:hypothetical protein